MNDYPGKFASDPYCRRWTHAYPQLMPGFVAEMLSSKMTTTTFACTGAVTYNVFRPKSAEHGAQKYQNANHTNRPSVFKDVPIYKKDAPHKGEQRQLVSLKNENTPSNPVDMVTITIGGNDMLFGDVHCTKCYRCYCVRQRLLQIQNRQIFRCRPR